MNEEYDPKAAILTPKKTKSTRKPVEAEVAVPEPARVNPIPGAPVVDGKFPGDDDYKYEAAMDQLNADQQELEAKLKAIVEVRHAINAVRPAVVEATSDEIWRSQKAIQARLIAARDDRKLKVAAVLKDMNLL
jgi:hypothetical protein